MKSIQFGPEVVLALTLAAAILGTGWELPQLSGLFGRAVVLCAQPWGLFLVVEAAFVAMLVLGGLAGVFVTWQGVSQSNDG